MRSQTRKTTRKENFCALKIISMFVFTLLQITRAAFYLRGDEEEVNALNAYCFVTHVRKVQKLRFLWKIPRKISLFFFVAVTNWKMFFFILFFLLNFVACVTDLRFLGEEAEEDPLREEKERFLRFMLWRRCHSSKF